MQPEIAPAKKQTKSDCIIIFNIKITCPVELFHLKLKNWTGINNFKSSLFCIAIFNNNVLVLVFQKLTQLKQNLQIWRYARTWSPLNFPTKQFTDLLLPNILERRFQRVVLFSLRATKYLGPGFRPIKIILICLIFCVSPLRYPLGLSTTPPKTAPQMPYCEIFQHQTPPAPSDLPSVWLCMWIIQAYKVLKVLTVLFRFYLRMSLRSAWDL